jgi:anti-sigma B factor antagonist
MTTKTSRHRNHSKSAGRDHGCGERIWGRDRDGWEAYNRLAMGLQELTVERYEGVAQDQRILLLRGPITIETAPQFERAVHHEHAETVILDLSDVPYIDSVGLGSLVAAYVSHQKSGRCLVLTAVKPRVRKIMEITKVNDFFVTFSTTWEAVEALANTGSA